MHYSCSLMKFNVHFFKYVLFVWSMLWISRQVECTEWLVDCSCIPGALVYGIMQNCTTSCLVASVQVVTVFVRSEHSSNWETNPSAWKDVLCILIMKANKMHYFSNLFSIKNKFRTDPLSITRSLNTVYTAIGICHASYVDCLLARSGSILTLFSIKNSTCFGQIHCPSPGGSTLYTQQ